MKIQIFVIILLFSISDVYTIFSQDDFVQFTRYDQLFWSPDGKQVAFRCLLLDESNPEKISANILVKDLSTNKLICLDPQPERFVILKDKKFLLFSSVYGLYLLSIEPELEAAQILFRNPAASWFFKDFGFYEKKGTIYVERYDYLSAQSVKENYQIDLANISRPLINISQIKKLRREVKANPFNLQVDEFINKKNYSIALKDFSIQFKKNSKNNYDLILQTQNSTDSKSLVKNCRPRLLSANSNNSLLIITLFKNKGYFTYLFDTHVKKLSLIENQRYFSVSWLDNSRYVCINENGMFLKKINLLGDLKLNNWFLPEWCQNIDRSFPKIDNLFDFFNSESTSEIKSFNGKTARIDYKKENFLRSRIVLTDDVKKERIIVDEMNNIPNRALW